MQVQSRRFQLLIIAAVANILVACGSSPVAVEPQTESVSSVSAVVEPDEIPLDENGEPIDLASLDTARLGSTTLTGTVERLPRRAGSGTLTGLWRVDGVTVWVRGNTTLPAETVEVGDAVVISGFEVTPTFVIADTVTLGSGSGGAVVNTLADENGSNPNACSLREAIIANNGDFNFGGCEDPNGVIQFDPSLNGGTITLTSDPELITADVEIDGPGEDLLTVSGNDQVLVFDIGQDRTVEIEGLTVSNGLADRSDTFGQSGGGILARDNTSLTLRSCTVSGNSARSSGGGVFIRIGSNVTVDNCTISGNTARFNNGGGLYLTSGGEATINESTFNDNSALRSGGGIFATTGEALTVTNSSFSGNCAGSASDVSGSSSSDGGAIYSTVSKLVVIGSSFTNNANNGSSGFGGGDGGAIFAGGSQVPDDEFVTIESTNFLGNTAGAGGGAIFLLQSDPVTATIRNSTLSGNSSVSGGAIFSGGNNESQLVTIIDQTIISENSTSGNGGGISFLNGTASITNSVIIDNSSSSSFSISGGGGISNNSLLNISGSVIDGNSSARDGGGIFNNGSLTIQSSSEVINNIADSHGAGIFNTGVAKIDNSFIRDNLANDSGGGIFNLTFTSGTATLDLFNNRFSGNAPENIINDGGSVTGSANIPSTCDLVVDDDFC